MKTSFLSVAAFKQAVPQGSDVSGDELAQLAARENKDSDWAVSSAESDVFTKQVANGGAGLSIRERQLTGVIADLTKPIDEASIVTVAGNTTPVTIPVTASTAISNITEPDLRALAQRASSDGTTVSIADLRAAAPVLTKAEILAAYKLAENYLDAAPDSRTQRVSDVAGFTVDVSLQNEARTKGDWPGLRGTDTNQNFGVEVSAPAGTKIIVSLNIGKSSADAVFEVPASGKLTLPGTTELKGGDFSPSNLGSATMWADRSAVLTVTAVADPDSSGPQLPKVVGRVSVAPPPAGWIPA